VVKRDSSPPEAILRNARGSSNGLTKDAFEAVGDEWGAEGPGIVAQLGAIDGDNQPQRLKAQRPEEEHAIERAKSWPVLSRAVVRCRTSQLQGKTGSGQTAHPRASSVGIVLITSEDQLGSVECEAA